MAHTKVKTRKNSTTARDCDLSRLVREASKGWRPTEEEIARSARRGLARAHASVKA